ncbi:MAG: DUF521 domain-containing protein [Planctomycetes bacterium]|nr:DUF521 domain-containing protein [Planctomycetota bacterium]
MRLTPFEESLLAGAEGDAARWAMEFQIEVGDFFAAEDFVKVRSAHVAADAEALRDEGIEFLEHICAVGGKCVIPTTTNPRGAAQVQSHRRCIAWRMRGRA